MSRRKHKRGYNGRRRAPRRKRPTVAATPVVIPAPARERTRTGPRTPEEQAKHAEMLDVIARTRDQLEQQDEAQWRREQREDGLPMVAGSVQFGANATTEFREALNGGSR